MAFVHGTGLDGREAVLSDDAIKPLCLRLWVTKPVAGLHACLLEEDHAGLHRCCCGTESNCGDESLEPLQYGGALAPDLKSGSFTSNNVTVSINAGSGTTLALSEAQVAELVQRIQRALRKQAERSKKRGEGEERGP